MAETLATIVSRVERMLHPAVASGFAQVEIQGYCADAVPEIELSYQDFANYVITTGSPGSISPTPYKRLVTNLLKDGKSTSTTSIGHRIDSYIETTSQLGREDSESLFPYI